MIYSVEKPYTLRISLGFADDIEAIMLNLSDLGMAIIASHNLPPGTLLYIKFNIIDLTMQGEARRRHMEITGEVATSIIMPDRNYRIGIRFDKISDENKLAISNFVKRNKFPSV